MSVTGRAGGPDAGFRAHLLGQETRAVHAGAAAAVKQAEAEIARTQKAVEEGLAHLKETLDHMTTTINEAIMAMLSAHDGKMVTVRAI